MPVPPSWDDDGLPRASLMSAGMSIPVRPVTVAFASATVRVTVLTTSDAPSFDSTVRVSMLPSGSAAARTMNDSR